MNEKVKKIKLRVSEASQDDAYKGIARIDNETMKCLEIKRGDVVIVKGNKETLAIVDRAYPADVGEGIIRIDGIIRKNAKTSIGEFVTIRKAEVKEAKNNKNVLDCKIYQVAHVTMKLFPILKYDIFSQCFELK
jgi:transitional endoplasmic reticulum ATPase